MQVEWAEANPEAVERIVMNANAFAADYLSEDYLSEEGQMCQAADAVRTAAIRSMAHQRAQE